jgi:hypothetical protein
VETTAFDLLIVPTISITFGGIVVGAVVLFVMQGVENVLRYLGSAWQEREKFPQTAPDLAPRPARPVTRRVMRLHG